MTTLSSMTALPEMPVRAAMTQFSPIWTLWPTWTRLSILVPRPMRVAPRAPRSMVVLAPISTSSAISNAPDLGELMVAAGLERISKPVAAHHATAVQDHAGTDASARDRA